MDFLFKIMLGIHIVTGSTGLIVGTIVAALPKGNKLHKTLGTIFLYAMIISGTISLYLATAHPNLFLFVIGIFTIYLSLSGYRIQKLRNLNNGQKPKIYDWIITYTMLAFAIIFLGYGLKNLFTNHINLGILFSFFGAISANFVRQDFYVLRGKWDYKYYWVATHISKMMGAYIASVTAFGVVNSQILKPIPELAIWMAPAFIGTYFITKWRLNIKNGTMKVFNI